MRKSGLYQAIQFFLKIFELKFGKNRFKYYLCYRKWRHTHIDPRELWHFFTRTM